MKTRYAISVYALALLAAGACSKPADRVEITETQERSDHRPPAKPGVTNAERFQLETSAGDFAMSAAGANEPLGFHSATPEGWQELPPSQFRQINLQFGPNGEGECYVSILPGGGGSILENVNRWRNQMGLGPFTADELAAHPTRTILGGASAVYVDLEGAYAGMGQGDAMPGYRMVGLLALHEGDGVFIKMVGPAALVAAELENFDAFAASLHSGAGHSHVDVAHATPPSSPMPQTGTAADLPPGHPPIDVAAAAPPAQAPDESPSGESTAQGFSWKIPEGWTAGPENTMRLVTYTIGDDPDHECYVSLLGGTAGGLAANINRWIAQFGGAPLSEDELAALPKITLLGEDVGLAEGEGDFTTMRGEQKSDQAMLGVAWISEQGSVFVKMTGPKDKVKNQKDAFIAFCASLKRI